MARGSGHRARRCRTPSCARSTPTASTARGGRASPPPLLGPPGSTPARSRPEGQCRAPAAADDARRVAGARAVARAPRAGSAPAARAASLLAAATGGPSPSLVSPCSTRTPSGRRGCRRATHPPAAHTTQSRGLHRALAALGSEHRAWPCRVTCSMMATMTVVPPATSLSSALGTSRYPPCSRMSARSVMAGASP